MKRHEPIWLLLGYDVVTTTTYILGFVRNVTRQQAIAEAARRSVIDAHSDDCTVGVIDYRGDSNVCSETHKFFRRCRVPASETPALVRRLGRELMKVFDSIKDKQTATE